MSRRTRLLTILAGAVLISGGAAAPAVSGSPAPSFGTTGAPSPEPTLVAPHPTSPGPGRAIGIASTAAGVPLDGVGVWMEVEAIYASPGRGVTGPDGRYQIEGLASQLIYSAHARYPLRYRDRDWCIRLAPATPLDDEVFGGADGAVRDFRWVLSGPIVSTISAPDEDGAWWGATIRLFPTFSDGVYDRVVELTLTPTGPLIDGSTGSVLTRSVDIGATVFVLDIPVGPYAVTATTVEADGMRLPLQVAQSGATPAPVAQLEFQPEDYSGHDCADAGANSGVERAFLDIVLP